MSASDLPNDRATLHAMVLAAAEERVVLTAQIALWRAAHDAAEARIARLHQLLKALDRARFGRRSERLGDDQIAFAFEEVETGLGAIEAALDDVEPQRERAPRQRKALPAHLERVEVVIEHRRRTRANRRRTWPQQIVQQRVTGLVASELDQAWRVWFREIG